MNVLLHETLSVSSKTLIYTQTVTKKKYVKKSKEFLVARQMLFFLQKILISLNQIKRCQGSKIYVSYQKHHKH